MTTPPDTDELVNFLHAKYPTTDRTDINELLLEIVATNQELTYEQRPNQPWLPKPDTIQSILATHPIDIVQFHLHLTRYRNHSSATPPSDKAFIAFIHSEAQSMDEKPS